MADKQKQELNDEQVVSYLQSIVDKIKTEEDPLELNNYRRLFRKAVPFTLRSYFAAWILKELTAGRNIGKPGTSFRNDRSGRNARKDRNEGRGEQKDRGDLRDRGDLKDRNEQKDRSGQKDRGDRNRQEFASGKTEQKERVRQSETRRNEPREQVKAEPRPVLADDVSTTLFISIGRNRRVYPRDLIGLILQNTGVDREHIGDIRVLDNYSFVQVITEDAAKIIEVLNDFEYRGRKLAVSYSRKREDSAETSDAAASSEPAIAESDVSDYAEESHDEPDSSDSWKDESNPSDDDEHNGNV